MLSQVGLSNVVLREYMKLWSPMWNASRLNKSNENNNQNDTIES